MLTKISEDIDKSDNEYSKLVDLLDKIPSEKDENPFKLPQK